jgi:hypothetical protein
MLTGTRNQGRFSRCDERSDAVFAAAPLCESLDALDEADGALARGRRPQQSRRVSSIRRDAAREKSQRKLPKQFDGRVILAAGSLAEIPK